MSFYPDPSLPKCGDPKRPWIKGALDVDELPEQPVASASGQRMAIQYLKSAVAITIDGREALRVDDPGGVDDAVSAAYWHGLDWIVEARGQIFVNGKKIKPGPFLSTAYYYRILGEQPFFFFDRLFGAVRLSYAGVVQDVKYDQVAFGLCCEPGFANPRHSKDAVQFFGRRGTTWYFVTAKTNP